MITKVVYSHNINDRVGVRLTEEGRRIRRAFFDELGLEPLNEQPDANGITWFQHWELMEMFGSHIRSCPFEGNEMIIEDRG